MRQSSFLVLSACAAILCSCSATVDQHGNLPAPDAVLAVQPGVDDRDQVAKVLGSPSTIATFNDKTWYYISKKTSRVSFWDPTVLDQEVLMVKFDDGGVVSDMKLYGLEDGRNITPDPNETPTYGRELTILQQLIGNIGRFAGGGTGGSSSIFNPGGNSH